jgi:hypothetical protein
LELYPWRRYWYPEGTELTFDNRDFLPDPQKKWARLYNTELRELAEVTSPCVVLLGEPGLGKSTIVRQEVENANTRDPNSVLLIDLRGYSSDHAVEEAVFKHPRFLAYAQSGTDSLTLYLDSLDELLLKESGAGQFIAQKLVGIDPKRLSLRIICRRAEWIPSLKSVLNSVYGPEAIGVYRLAPLTADNIIVAVNQSGCDGEYFLHEVISRKLQSLARKPLTFNLLISTFRHEQAFPSSDLDLMRRGCLTLAAETNLSRLEKGEVGTKSDVERLMIAERIAALCVLCSRQKIASTPDSLTEPDRLLVSDIIGSSNIRSDGVVDVQSLREVLATALFSRIGPNDAEWDHRSFAEYLAANYLARHGLGAKILNEVLFADIHGKRRVPPQLVEFAGWLGRLRYEFKEELIKVDPIVLLRSDVSTISGHDSKRLASAILELMRKEVIEEELFGAKLRLLDHEHFSYRVLPFLSHHSRVDQRRVAIEIVEECKLLDLIDVLISIACERSESDHIRSYALRCVSRIADDGQKQSVRVLLSNYGDDPDDEVKGAVLSCLWPKYLSSEELFQELTRPKNESLFGSYSAFLHRVAQDDDFSLDQRGVRLGLEWVRQNPELSGAYYFAEIRARIIKLAWEAVERSQTVCSSLAELVIDSIEKHQSVIPNDEDDGRDFSRLVENDDTHRRIFLQSLFRQAYVRAVNHRFLVYAPDSPLLENDVYWLIERLGETSGEERDYLLKTIEEFPPNNTVLNQIRRGLDEGKIGQPFNSWIFVELGSAQMKMERSSYAKRLWYQHRSLARDRRLKRRLEERGVTPFVAAVEVNSPQTWAQFADRILRDRLSPKQALDKVAAGPADRLRLLQAAKEYVIQHTVDLTGWVKRDQIPAVAVSLHAAFELIYEEDEDFLRNKDQNFWKSSALLLIWYPFGGEAVIRGLIGMLFSATPEHARAAFGELLYTSDSSASRAVRRTREHWSVQDESAVFSALINAGFSQSWAEDAVHELILRGHTGILRAAFSVLDSPPSKVTEQELMLASAVVQPSLRGAWDRARVHIYSDSEFGNKLFEKIVTRSNFSFITRLSVRELQELLSFMFSRFPLSKDPRRRGPYSPGFADLVVDLRRIVLGNLENRGPEGVEALRKIRRKFKDESWLEWVIARAKLNSYRTIWQPISPDHFLKSIAQAEPPWRQKVAEPYISWAISFGFGLFGLVPSAHTLRDRVLLGLSMGLSTLLLTTLLRKPKPWWLPALIICTPAVIVLTMRFFLL